MKGRPAGVRSPCRAVPGGSGLTGATGDVPAISDEDGDSAADPARAGHRPTPVRVVLAGRLLPVVRTFIAFPAGVSRMPMGKFIAYTFVGSYPWCWGLAWAGMWLGEAWHTDPRFKAVYRRFEVVVVVAGVLLVAWFVWHKVKEARAARTGAAS